jgi:outer membrane murein-binding lipoprotein Lpp
MAYDRESILQQYPSEITDILKATTADPKDKTARLKVATTLARVLSFTKRRTGEDRTPQDTEVYKLAATIRQARSQEQFETLLQQLVPKAKSGILEKYNLAWKLSWSTGQGQGQEKKPRKRRARKVEVSEAAPDINARIDALSTAQAEGQAKKPRKRRVRLTEVSEAVPDINARIDALEEAVSRIRSQFSDLQAKTESSGTRKLAGQLAEVLQKLKAHQHDREDGKAYILEKKEI